MSAELFLVGFVVGALVVTILALLIDLAVRREIAAADRMGAALTPGVTSGYDDRPVYPDDADDA